LLEGEAPDGLWEGLATQIDARGFTVVQVPHEGMIHGANGLTDYGANTVTVRENMSPAAQVKTLTHELAHVMLHGTNNPDASGNCGFCEGECESVVLIVDAAYVTDSSSYKSPYVTGWASTVKVSSPVEVVQAAGDRVQKTATEILDQLDT